MATTTKPTAHINWVPDSGSANLGAPPANISSVGFQPGQPVPAPWLNYLLHNLGRWTEYFDQGLNSTVLATSLDQGMRLLGGGTWGYSAATGVLSWDAPFNLAIPSAADADNTVAAGQVTLPAGSVAYVQANTPFTTTGDVTQGSDQVENLAYELGIEAGMGVIGPGIPSGTTVLSLTDTTATLSAPATASSTQASLTFAGSGPLTLTVADGATLVPNPQTVVVARGLGQAALVGVNAGTMVLRDKEARGLHTAGYVTTVQAPAGQALTAQQAVYISLGASDGRTAGAAYPADASIANGPTRAGFVGFAHTATATGDTAHLVTGGFLGGFTSLTPGALYYLDPTTPGGITATRPTVTNQVIAPVGVATSASTLAVNPAGAAANSVVQGASSWANYTVSSEAQLGTALAAAQSGGGGVIVLSAPFTLSQGYTVTDAVLVQGRKGASTLTVLPGGGLIMASGGELRDVYLGTTATTGNLVTVTGDYATLQACRLTLPPQSTCVGVAVTGSGTRLVRTQLAGVGPQSTATGIAYVSGTDNLDESTTILS